MKWPVQRLLDILDSAIGSSIRLSALSVCFRLHSQFKLVAVPAEDGLSQFISDRNGERCRHVNENAHQSPSPFHILVGRRLGYTARVSWNVGQHSNR